MRELTGPDAVALAQAQAARAAPLLLLDVREPWEVALAAIDLPGATTRTMPMREVPARLAELDAAQPVLLLSSRRPQRAGRRIPGARRVRLGL